MSRCACSSHEQVGRLTIGGMARRVDPDAAADVMRAAGLEPLEPYPGRHVGWLCECIACGAEVSPRYGNVVVRGKGCLICSGNFADPDRAVRELRQAGATPLEPYPGANKNWRSRCDTCQKEISPRITHIRSGKSACGYCAGQRLDPDEALALVRSRELTPLEPYPGKNDLPWKCTCERCGRQVSPSYASMRRGSSCGFCSGNRADSSEAEAMMREAGFEPLAPYPGDRPWRCTCLQCGRESSPWPGSVRRGSRCAYCSRNRIDPAEAARTMREAGLEPHGPYLGATVPWHCTCKTCGRDVFPYYTSVASNGSRCGYCSGNRVDVEAATATMRECGLEPLEPYVNASTPWRSLCLKCGNEVAPRWSSVQQGHGCFQCAGVVIGAKRRRSDREAAQLMDLAGATPLETYPGGHKAWKCRCHVCGRTCTPMLSNVLRGQGPCKRCGVVARAASKRHPEAAARAVMVEAGLEPLEEYPGSNHPWKCRCVTCDREVKPRYLSVVRGGGCAHCAKYGFDPTASALIYLIENEDLEAVKVGIAGTDRVYDRVQIHAAHGWSLIGKWETSSGYMAMSVEDVILKFWRDDLELPIAADPNEMPQGGWTETAPLLQTDIAATISLLELALSER